jgi:hypothetical protein
MNFIKSRVFVSLLTQSPTFLIKIPAVEALIRRVSIEHPAILKSEIKVNFLLSAKSEAIIRANEIPTAPLNPP